MSRLAVKMVAYPTKLSGCHLPEALCIQSVLFAFVHEGFSLPDLVLLEARSTTRFSVLPTGFAG